MNSDIDLENLDNDELFEMLSMLEGLDDELKEIEEGMNDESSK